MSQDLQVFPAVTVNMAAITIIFNGAEDGGVQQKTIPMMPGFVTLTRVTMISGGTLKIKGMDVQSGA